MGGQGRGTVRPAAPRLSSVCWEPGLRAIWAPFPLSVCALGSHAVRSRLPTSCCLLLVSSAAWRSSCSPRSTSARSASCRFQPSTTRARVSGEESQMEFHSNVFALFLPTGVGSTATFSQELINPPPAPGMNKEMLVGHPLYTIPWQPPRRDPPAFCYPGTLSNCSIMMSFLRSAVTATANCCCSSSTRVCRLWIWRSQCWEGG